MSNNRVLLIERSTILAQLIKQVLQNDPTLELVGHAISASEASHLVAETRPDLILIDAPLRGMGIQDVIPLVLSRAPSAQVIVLTDQWESRYLKAVVRYGISNCIRKDRIATDLVPTVNRITRGRLQKSWDIQPHLVKEFV